MANLKDIRFNIKTYLAILWSMFTVTMITWWWIYGLRLSNEVLAIDPRMAKGYRMLLWEGGSLLIVVSIGGLALTMYVYRDSKRTESLRLFFAGFSHDIKTSIARLRLQSDVLMEEPEFQSHVVLKRLVQDISRLELQLENSLMLASPSDTKLILERNLFGEILSKVRTDFPELQFQLEKDFAILADRRAVYAILRNLFYNSSRHGEATKINIKIERIGAFYQIIILDNGKGRKVTREQTTLQSDASRSNRNGSGTGMGLNLSQNLVQRMDGQFEVLDSENGFAVKIVLPAADKDTKLAASTNSSGNGEVK